MVARGQVPGSAALVLVDGAALLRPEVQVFEAMLDGWRAQKVSRSLNSASINGAMGVVRRFQDHSGEFPWSWTPAHFEEWTMDLRTIRQCAWTTTRGYQAMVRMFLGYVCNPVYGWDRVCEAEFGSFPAQICTPWNTAKHRSEYEGRPERRAMTRNELSRLFGAADDAVEQIARFGGKGYASAYRDSAMIKVAYGWGLRRAEVVGLDVVDFASNPKAPEFGSFGVCNVRYGKANAGSPPKRRGTLTVFAWAARVVEDWVDNVWPHYRSADSNALWPSERSERVGCHQFDVAFKKILRKAELPDELTLHSLRHSYVTHLVEDGFDGLFVQQQVGHEHASTTSIYTSVSSDYRTRVLRSALDEVISRASQRPQEAP
jgi:integrase/recombinase XerC